MAALLTGRHGLVHEYRVLLAEYGRAQARCSALLALHVADMAALQAQVMRLRATAIVQQTKLAFEQQDRAALQTAAPGLPRRVALARRVEQLLERIQTLVRERQRWQWSAARVLAVPPQAQARPVTRVATRPVLWISREGAGSALSLQGAGAHHAHMLSLDTTHGIDEAALEASLAAADMVICQTGCLSHNAYWRVQDHCQRTGKTCVLVAQPPSPAVPENINGDKVFTVSPLS